MPQTYEPIATTTVSSSGSSVTFSSIPSTYTDLILISSAQRNAPGSGGDGLKCQLNGDTGSNYSWTSLSGGPFVNPPGSGRSTNQTIFIAGSAEDGVYTVNVAHFLNYANTSVNKTIIARSNSSGSQGVGLTVNLWRSTAAISSLLINCASGFVAGSTFTLYGIKAA